MPRHGLSRITLRSIRATARGERPRTTQGRSGITWAEKWPAIRYRGSVASWAPGLEVVTGRSVVLDVIRRVVTFLCDHAANLTARQDADGADEEDMTWWPNNPPH